MTAQISNFYQLTPEEALAAVRQGLIQLGYSQTTVDKMSDEVVMSSGVKRLERDGLIPSKQSILGASAPMASTPVSDVELITLRQAASALGSILAKVYPPTQATDPSAIMSYAMTVCQLATDEMLTVKHQLAMSAKFSKPEFEVGTKVMILDFNDGSGVQKADDWAGCIGVIDSIDRVIVRNENANGTSLSEGDAKYSVFISEPAQYANKTARNITHWRLQPVR